MIKQEGGFSLVELMITMVISVLVLYATSRVFTGLLTQFKQQSKIAESDTEGIVGLEILRRDLQGAGYGLPTDLNGATYREIESESLTPWIDRDFNDGPPDNPSRGTDSAGNSNPPAGIRSLNGSSLSAPSLNGSDVLVIKSINVANITNAGNNSACSKWTYLGAVSPYVTTWTSAGENLTGTDRVIVLTPSLTGAFSMKLIKNSSGSFWTTYSGVTGADWIPTDPSETRIVYGVDSNTDLRMPFNRADYYIRPSSGMAPSRCAPNTDVLFKSLTRQDNGTHYELPLLDCVADMQVVYGLDTNGDGTIDGFSDADITQSLTAQQIRDEVKEVRVYILAHEGQIDRNFRFNNFSADACATCIRVGETAIGWYHDINLANLTADYRNYRWKLYTIVVRPNSLTGAKYAQ